MVKNRCRDLSCIRVDSLEDIERLYHHLECECELCRKGDIMKADLKWNDVLKFSGGREVTGRELKRKAAEQEIIQLMKHYKESRPDLNLTVEDMLHEICKKRPDLGAAYLGM